MAGKIMWGRTVEYSTTPYNGTYTDTGKSFVAICTKMYPEIGENRQEVEATTSCSTAREYVAGMPDPTTWEVEIVFQGADSADYGIGASALPALARAGATIAVKDSTTQFGAHDICHRFDVVLLNCVFGGGDLNALQTAKISGRITGRVDRTDIS